MNSISNETMNHQFKKLGVDGYPVRLLGIRGYDLSMGIPDQNDSNIYDDLICLTDGENTTSFVASVDPGDYWIKQPMNPKGCARLACGLYWYKAGLHKDRTALVQAESVNVERLDKNGKFTELEKDVFVGCNIHSGGDAEKVERWSAGCQIIFSSEGAWGKTWQRFIHKTLDLMGQHRQNRIPYLLVDSLKPIHENIS